MTAVSKAALLGLALVGFMPIEALACPSCLAAQDSNVQQAFINSSVFMSVLPLVLVGALVFWLRRRARRFALEEAAGVIRLPTPAPRSNRAA